jgi:transposase
MVRASFVPPPPIRALRELTRYRRTQVEARTRELQRLDKVLQDAGIKISSVASKVWTVSTRAMIEAMIDGQDDPVALAELARGKMRIKRDQLQTALTGRFGAHHRIVARQIIAHIDFLDASISELTAQIQAQLVPFARTIELLCTIPGIGETSAQIIVAETGGDMSRFPTAAHLAAWTGVAPANHESAGKRRPAGTRHGNQWLASTLVECAHAAGRSKASYFSTQYYRMGGRRCPNKAAMAVAHSLTIAIWHVLTNDAPHVDLGADYLDTRRRDPDLETRRLVKRLEALGHTVTLQAA